jgi:hypothetical protein
VASSYPVSGRPSLILSCLDRDECVVYSEPWGSGHSLKRGDTLRLETDALVKAAVEVSHVPGGISVCVSSDDEVRMRPTLTADGVPVAHRQMRRVGRF